MVFKPDSTCERHQKYFGAFSDPMALDNRTIYMTYITRFINDGAISPSNEDDIQFFRDLLFESCWGRLHHTYYEYILERWIKIAFTQSMTILSKYADFLLPVSELFVKDMFHDIFKMNQSQLIVTSLFELLSPENKVILIKVGMIYPSIIKEIPKFKMYLLFS